MDKQRFNDLKAFVKSLAEKYDVKDLVGEIYSLHQEGFIREREETILYGVADPQGKCNNPAELWLDDYECPELWDYVKRSSEPDYDESSFYEAMIEDRRYR